MATFTENPKLSNRFASALQFAFEAHKNQIRKQGEVPYVSHLMAVSGLVLESGGSEDEAIAALLHDVIEDALENENSPAFKGCPTLDNPTEKDSLYILAEEMGFGWEVARIVDAVSEDKALSSEQRKPAYVSSVANGGDSVILVSCADKLHNLRSYATDGRSLWKPATAEFYDKLMPVYEACERIPSHWIEEIGRLLAGLREEMVCISKSELDHLQHW